MDPSFTPRISAEKCIQTGVSCRIQGSLFDSVDAYSCFWNVLNVSVKVGGGLVPRDVVWTLARMGHPMTRMREQGNLSVRVLKRVLNYSTSQRPWSSYNCWCRCIGYPENLVSKTYFRTFLKYSPKTLKTATLKMAAYVSLLNNFTRTYYLKYALNIQYIHSLKWWPFNCFS
jgi:hypothetical protein